MADVTLGFKVSEEVKERAKQMIEASGLSAKDWIQSAITMYESKNVGMEAPEFVTSLHELEVHTTRIHELAVHMVQQSMHLKDQAVREAYKEADRKDELVAELQEKVRDVKEQLQALTDENSTLREALEQATTQATEAKQVRDTQQTLVTELQMKVEALAEQAVAYETLKKEVVQAEKATKVAHTQLVAQYEAQLTSLQKEHQTLKNDAIDAEKATSAHVKELEQALQQLRHEQALQQKEHDLALQQAVMQAEQSYQQKLQAQMDTYNDKLFQLMTKNSDKADD